MTEDEEYTATFGFGNMKPGERVPIGEGIYFEKSMDSVGKLLAAVGWGHSAPTRPMKLRMEMSADGKDIAVSLKNIPIMPIEETEHDCIVDGHCCCYEDGYGCCFCDA